MTDSDPRSRVRDRLRVLREADARLATSLDAVAAAAGQLAGGAIEREPVDEIANAATTLRQPVPAALQPAADAQSRIGEPTVGARPPGVRASDAAQAAYVAVGQAAASAAALFTTGRLMFEGAACDFATDRMKTYAGVTKALNALLPQVVAVELREGGLACQCQCPMCGLGACGCIWASLHNIDLAWGGPGLAAPDERGIVLRSPPRGGSELAAAGVGQWDRIVSVDGEPVRAPGELQAALRQHAIGEEVRIGITRDGESREIRAHHVSDVS